MVVETLDPLLLRGLLRQRGNSGLVRIWHHGDITEPRHKCEKLRAASANRPFSMSLRRFYRCPAGERRPITTNVEDGRHCASIDDLCKNRAR